ncbi:hypothetical protein PENTCL1PPCAC_29346, partial [Pristionchus entomophagus]
FQSVVHVLDYLSIPRVNAPSSATNEMTIRCGRLTVSVKMLVSVIQRDVRTECRQCSSRENQYSVKIDSGPQSPETQQRQLPAERNESVRIFRARHSAVLKSFVLN